MKLIYTAILSVIAGASAFAAQPSKVVLTKDQLDQKLKGGWAAQTIGVVYGGPTEFRYQGSMIHDYTPIVWQDDYVKWYHQNAPGLYDDIYMDITFVDVFEKEGLDASVDKFAHAYANAGYPLWHANQAARYNILNGIMPPESGHWHNNPHANDLDFQIEADFAGLMSPGMVNAAVNFTDDIGHIMNYGDGWYGGVYIAAMYSLAYIYDDVETIVLEALKCIPKQSKYYQCMSDVIGWWRDNPEDWRATWFECEKRWSADIGCPDGVFAPFNIDATINSAYVLIGLLYGEGDFVKTLDIATRCGQDSDCNPSSAAGILGTMIGYDNLPAYMLEDIKSSEDIKFQYTDMSLNDLYRVGLKHALQVIEINGGEVNGDSVEIIPQQPTAVRLEESFVDHYPVEMIQKNKSILEVGEQSFDGVGLTVSYYFQNIEPMEDYVAQVEIYLDSKLVETTKMPVDFHSRKHDLYWVFNLEKGEHNVRFNWLNPIEGIDLMVRNYIIYDNIR